MANLPAVGTGPLMLLDANGKQHEIPLSLISFGAGNVASTSSAASASLKALLDPLLPGLVAQRFLQPAPAPPSSPVFTITAAVAGSIGNAISVSFSNPVTSPNAAVDVTVTATQVYAGLTTQTLGTVIGTSSASGSMPGLALLATIAPATVGMPIAGLTQFQSSGTTYTAAIPGSSGTAFTLQAIPVTPPVATADAGLLTATISALTTTTFTLTINWQKFVSNVLLTSLASLNAQFGYVLKFVPPASGAPPAGTAYATPRVGTVLLGGGTDPAAAIPAQSASAASATVVSG